MVPRVQLPPEIQLAQRLAGNEQVTRDRAVRKLRKYIVARTQEAAGRRLASWVWAGGASRAGPGPGTPRGAGPGAGAPRGAGPGVGRGAAGGSSGRGCVTWEPCGASTWQGGLQTVLHAPRPHTPAAFVTVILV